MGPNGKAKCSNGHEWAVAVENVDDESGPVGVRWTPGRCPVCGGQAESVAQGGGSE